MVDETAYRQVLHSTTPKACSFAKAILASGCACSLAERHYLAEREAVACTDAAAFANCAALHGLLAQNSAFAVKHVRAAEPYTHAQEMKVQCGGLQGVQLAVTGTRTVADVAGLVAAAFRKFGSLEKLPYSEIVQSVAARQLRRRSDRG